MIRTRDFVLFILILVFLGVAIVATLGSNRQSAVHMEPVEFAIDTYTYKATSTTISIDRQSVINRLKEKVAQSSQRISPSPSVEAPAQDHQTSADESLVRLQKCTYPDDTLSKVPQWPFAEVQTKVENGQRIYFTTRIQDVPVNTASTTASTTTSVKETVTQTVLQLPVVPVVQPAVSCVPSEVVGVTPEGLLIFNSSVATYAGIGSNTLIGYARDGFPIYGMYDGEVDTCGGYNDGSGYRYALASDRTFIIGCFMGSPSVFNL